MVPEINTPHYVFMTRFMVYMDRLLQTPARPSLGFAHTVNHLTGWLITANRATPAPAELVDARVTELTVLRGASHLIAPFPYSLRW